MPLIAGVKAFLFIAVSWSSAAVADDRSRDPKDATRTVHEDTRETLKDLRFSMPFEGKTAEEFATWKKSFRAKLNELLGDTTPPKQWKVTEKSVAKLDDYTRYELALHTDDVPSVPLYVLVPNSIEAGVKTPAVLCVHGHGNYGHHPIVGRTDLQGVAKSIAAANYGYGLQFVKRGYIVAAPCMIPFGDRVEKNKYGGDPCATNFVRMQALGKVPMGENLRDLKWCVSYLQSRPDVAADRIGCAGLSYGGRMTMLVTAMDERIQVACVSGALNLLQERMGLRHSCGSQIIPGLLKYGDYSEIGSLIAPRPCIWETGSKDSLIVPQWDDLFRNRLNHAYQAAGVPKSIHYDRFEGGHRWNGKVAYPVFAKILNPN